jgi:trehalose 6-phosphate phosphatase
MLPPSQIRAKDFAFFLDFDGTLAPLAERPDAVCLDPATKDALASLYRHLNGAIAIVTGRDIDVIDGYLAPLRLPVAGVHGAQRRDSCGNMHGEAESDAVAFAVEQAVTGLMARYPALLLEKKHGAIALHYRAHPELDKTCIHLLEDAVRDLPNVELKRGKMVVEAIADAGRNKGTAVADFMREPPFFGRIPLFAGDDVTDEDAFGWVADVGGMTIKIGDGATRASFRMPSIDAFLKWLTSLSRDLDGEHA